MIMQTDSDFSEIQIYRAICRYMPTSEADDSMTHTEQEVPHSPNMTSHSEDIQHHFDSNDQFGDGLGLPEQVPDIMYAEDQVCESENQMIFTTLDTLYPETNVHIKTEKQEPMDLPSCGHYKSDVFPPLYNQTYDDEDLSQFIFGVLKQDIEEVCRILHIAQNPRFWSRDDVRKWLHWHASDYGANIADISLFAMDGHEFCQLTKDHFRLMPTEAWENIYHQLEAWMSACVLDSPCVSPSTEDRCYQEFTNIPLIASSPSHSVCSDDSDSSCHNDDFPVRRTSACSRPANVEGKQQTIHLWQFLKELLVHPKNLSNCIKWVDQKEGIFKIEDSARVAKLWGQRKNRPAMNYDKLSRSIRQYYKKGIIKKTTHSKRLVYQFCQPFL